MNKYKNTIANLLPHRHQASLPNEKKEALQISNPLNQENPTMLITLSKNGKKLAWKHVYLMYSRIQNKFQLRFSTLFKALALLKVYDNLSWESKEMPQQYALIICLNLSMKYQQIYLPRLKSILPFLKITSFDMNQYLKYELAFLQAIHADLNIPTAKTIMDKYLANQQMTAYWHAYYLLELSFMEEKLKEFTLEEICLGIVTIMTRFGDTLKKKTRVGSKAEEERVDFCAQAIFKAKYKSTEKQTAIYKKYTKEIYGKVSQNLIFLEV